MSTLLRTFWKNRSLKRNVRGRRLVPTLDGLDQRCLLDAGIGYVQTNLVSDIKELARTTDPNLQSPHGASRRTPRASSARRTTATGVSAEYNAHPVRSLVRRSPSPRPRASAPPLRIAPTGTSSTPPATSSSATTARAPRRAVIFSSENGTIVSFNPAVDPNEGILKATIYPSPVRFSRLRSPQEVMSTGRTTSTQATSITAP